MGKAAQNRATPSYRARLAQRGVRRFEILAPETDRDLILGLARRLVEDGPEAERVRVAVSNMVVGEPSKPGRILAALRRSPLVGADLDLSRPREEGRMVQL